MTGQISSGFVHRNNRDTSWDSICTRCFITVATEREEIKLHKHELEHNCDPYARAQMAQAQETMRERLI